MCAYLGLCQVASSWGSLLQDGHTLKDPDFENNSFFLLHGSVQLDLDLKSSCLMLKPKTRALSSEPAESRSLACAGEGETVRIQLTG